MRFSLSGKETVVLNLFLAQYVPITQAEGPGSRFALWFQGCPFRCPGCCNPEFLTDQGGELVAVTTIKQAIFAVHTQIEGITLLGGEPFAQATAAAQLAQYAHSLGLSVMVFTGYLLEDLQAKADAAISLLLQEIDLLIDGPYVRELPDTKRRWIGSTNQRIHCLTPRYRADAEFWNEPNTLEIRYSPEGLEVNGFPAAPAIRFWRGKLRSSLPTVPAEQT